MRPCSQNASVAEKYSFGVFRALSHMTAVSYGSSESPTSKAYSLTKHQISATCCLLPVGGVLFILTWQASLLVCVLPRWDRDVDSHYQHGVRGFDVHVAGRQRRSYDDQCWHNGKGLQEQGIALEATKTTVTGKKGDIFVQNCPKKRGEKKLFQSWVMQVLRNAAGLLTGAFACRWIISTTTWPSWSSPKTCALASAVTTRPVTEGNGLMKRIYWTGCLHL